jgi:hypothetical protein
VVSSSFASVVASFPVVGACSAVGCHAAGRRVVSAAVACARAWLAGAAVGLPVPASALPRLRSSFASGRAAGVSPARLAVLARVGRLLAAASAPVAVCPLASGAGVPASCLGVSSSGFVPAGRGAVVVRSWSVDFGVLSVCVSGVALPFVCLSGGLSGLAFDALVSAVRVAESSGVAVSLWAAPGRSGRVCAPRAGSAGYFCGVSAA